MVQSQHRALSDPLAPFRMLLAAARRGPTAGCRSLTRPIVANRVDLARPFSSRREECVDRLQRLDQVKRGRVSLKPLKTKQHGVGILHDPLWNKGMAMTISE